MERLALQRMDIPTRSKVIGQVLYQQALPQPPLLGQLSQQLQLPMRRRPSLAIRRSPMNSYDEVCRRLSQDQRTLCPHRSSMHMQPKSLWALDLLLHHRYPKAGSLTSTLILASITTFISRLSLHNGSFQKDPHH